jgi:hypothetical protein
MNEESFPVDTNFSAPQESASLKVIEEGSFYSPREEFTDDDSYEDSRLFDEGDETLSLEDPYAMNVNKLNTWDFRGRLSPGEGEKEFEMFSLYRDSGSGRSTKYVSLTFNFAENRILKIAEKNCWAKRVADYDRHNLQLLLQEENSRRAIEHKKKLEEYRQTQEFIGRSLSANAAKLAAVANRTLDRVLREGENLDLRDVPGIIAAASKAADLGKNLQASSLGVDQLLAALEEVEE